MSLWAECNGTGHIKPLKGELWRMVESQAQVASMTLVDTLEEQAVLEEILDAAKPPYRDPVEGLHYLLKTPFRYPPLKWGSRFGRRHEPSLFYGGCDQRATLIESAFYRLVFFFSIEGEKPEKMRTEHTLFSVSCGTGKGVELDRPPFDAHQEHLTHKKDYSVTQRLGTDMREAGVESFIYRSARSDDGARCGALFTLKAFSSNMPGSTSQWLCETSRDGVCFKGFGESTVHSFDVHLFTVNGEFPSAA